MNYIRKNGIALVLILVGISFLAIGIGRGEIETVFRKATNICMECIGLG